MVCRNNLVLLLVNPMTSMRVHSNHRKNEREDYEHTCLKNADASLDFDKEVIRDVSNRIDAIVAKLFPDAHQAVIQESPGVDHVRKVNPTATVPDHEVAKALISSVAETGMSSQPLKVREREHPWFCKNIATEVKRGILSRYSSRF